MSYWAKSHSFAYKNILFEIFALWAVPRSSALCLFLFIFVLTTRWFDPRRWLRKVNIFRPTDPSRKGVLPHVRRKTSHIWSRYFVPLIIIFWVLSYDALMGLGEASIAIFYLYLIKAKGQFNPPAPARKAPRSTSERKPIFLWLSYFECGSMIPSGAKKASHQGV